MSLSTALTVRRPRAIAAAWVLAALLAACAAPAHVAEPKLAPGDTRDHVVSVMGAPVATHALPGGLTRLEYSRGASGRVTYMVDLGPDGRLVRWEQVRDDPHFQRLKAGMTREQVLVALGMPDERENDTLPTPQETWTYRYEAHNLCKVFQIGFAESTGQTIDGGQSTSDPRCGAPTQ